MEKFWHVWGGGVSYLKRGTREGGWQAYFGGVVGVELDYDCALERYMLAIVTGWLRGGEYHGGFESYVGSHDAVMFNRGLGE